LSKTIGNVQKPVHDCSSNSLQATQTRTRNFHETLAIIPRVREKLANFGDFFRRRTSYFYWEKHCYEPLPACFRLRNNFDAIDQASTSHREVRRPDHEPDKIDAIQPQLVGLIPHRFARQEVNRKW